jgi:hypothetical protein
MKSAMEFSTLYTLFDEFMPRQTLQMKCKELGLDFEEVMSLANRVYTQEIFPAQPDMAPKFITELPNDEALYRCRLAAQKAAHAVLRHMAGIQSQARR